MPDDSRTNGKKLPGFERWMVAAYGAAAVLFIGLHPRGAVAPLTDWRSLTAGALALAASVAAAYASDRKAGFAVAIGFVNGYAAAGIAYQFV
ncbi:hypothetical protein ABT095_36925 [Kitasatospora sp. NPDC002227]|uniref:hypothetical protein n=1 Tax=Kitasatospora sp. NPDC002227 TaxID=3154773 RepID=UPI00332DB6C7